MIAAIAGFLGLKGKEHLVKYGLIVIGVLLLIGAFYAMLDAYGDSRYDAGKADADAAWIEAGNRLVEKAQKAGTKADKAAAGRAADFAAKQEDEKEKIDAAVDEGSSPLDVLFGTDGR